MIYDRKCVLRSRRNIATAMRISSVAENILVVLQSSALPLQKITAWVLGAESGAALEALADIAILEK